MAFPFHRTRSTAGPRGPCLALYPHGHPLLALWLLALWLLGSFPPAVRSQESSESSESSESQRVAEDLAATESDPLRRAAAWPLERVRLRDGRELRGLILSEGPEGLEFVEIVRQAGRPMDAILRFPDPATVVERQRLPAEDRARLLRRYHEFKHRVRIELRRMGQLSLGELTRDGVPFHTYQGRWFSVWSTADEEMTRRCIVRIEQIVRAYRQLLPPTRDAGGGFRVLLFGSMDEYRGYLQRLGLQLDNPAFYSASQNLIVAGSNLARYSERLHQVRNRNVAILRHYDRVLNPAFDKFLRERSKEIKASGGSLEEIALRRAAWDSEYTDLRRRISESNRHNEAKFAEVTERMFTRLYHEAFHAYLENHVYSRSDSEVPRWLNEGLAQVFEAGRFDADTLRTDAPDRERLAELQRSLRQRPLPLAELLTETGDELPAVHGGEYSSEHYLYAWGLAYYLSFYADLLDRERLDEYVSTRAARSDPIRRFERLVGMDLIEFERRWRTIMLKLPIPPKSSR